MVLIWYSDAVQRYTVEYKSNNNVVYSCKYHVIKQYIEQQKRV
jgi:hypothetical protein